MALTKITDKQVTYKQGAAGSTVRNLGDKLRESVSVFDFMTAAEIANVQLRLASIDVADSIQKALDYAASTGVTLYIPAGTYGISKLAYHNSGSGKPFLLLGAGQRSTIFEKYGTSTEALLSFSTEAAVLETYYKISNLTLRGNSGASVHNGLVLTKFARFKVEQVEIRDCATGLDAQGCLVGEFDQLLVKDNEIGIKTRKSDSVYCNNLTFHRCVIVGNTSFGADLGEGSGMHFIDCDVESNGTSANTSTGGFIFRSSLDDEVGFSLITFDSTHFESNLGWTLNTENSASSLRISLRDCPILAAESGRAAQFLYAALVSLDGVVAASVGDTVSVSSNVSTFICTASTINTLTNSCSNYTYNGVTTNSGLNLFAISRSGVSSILEGAGVVSVGSTSAIGGGKLGVAFDGATQNGIALKNTASGTMYALELRNSSNAAIGYLLSGTGAPTLDAPISSLYLRQDGGATTSLYVKTVAGAGAGNWTAK